MFIERLNKPYYLFQPAQLIRRITRAVGGEAPPIHEISLPWAAPIVYSPRESIGRSLWTTGVYEISVTEVLWRLADPGEVVVDAGANIGYMTSVLARRVGPLGIVHAFEPHPAVHSRLLNNIDLWRQRLNWSHVRPSRNALAGTSGHGTLYTDQSFDDNWGTASLVQPTSASDRIDVTLSTVDEAVGNHTAIGLLKIDVEGREHDVLLGAEQSLRRQSIRDIVFESHANAEPAVELLRGYGYHIFKLSRSLLKPLLRPVTATVTSRWEPSNYVATIDPSRCELRLAPLGWRVLVKRRRRIQ